jgi:hypothetical protein
MVLRFGDGSGAAAVFLHAPLHFPLSEVFGFSVKTGREGKPRCCRIDYVSDMKFYLLHRLSAAA